MKTLGLLLAGLLLVSLIVGAGEVITNDTGEDATGLRVSFSTPVLITAFGDILTSVDPQMLAFGFVFSGGTVEPWESHWFNYAPTTARVMETEWLASIPTAPQGLPLEQLSPRPLVTGALLNPEFFTHPAYVIQGTSDRDSVCAMPLDGIEELSLYPIIGGVDPESVAWSLDVSDSDGIGAGIEDGILYIWGNDPAWAGYGEVILQATLGDAVSSVAIPVTVFREDKTLINAEGRKDYFVPWSPELDINRILSVEEHMQTYNKDEGDLDRSIQWSMWRRMEFEKAVELATFWENEKSSNGVWPRASQFILVDVLLRDLQYLGVKSISFFNEYYIESGEDPNIVPLHYQNLPGPTKDPEEEAYIINEAHRLGIAVTTGNFVSIGNEGEWAELFYASPHPLSTFFSNFVTLNDTSIRHWTSLGVDCIEPSPVLASMNKFDNTEAEALVIDDSIARIADRARELYPGPLFHGSGYGVELFPGEPLATAPFHQHFDIIGMGGWNLPQLTRYSSSTLAQLISGWQSLEREVLLPFQEKWNKPLLLWEVGCPSVRGCSNYGAVCIQLPFYETADQSVEDMSDFFRSNVLALTDTEGFYGTRWSWFPLSRYDTGAVKDRGMNFRGKIEDAIQEAFLGQVVPREIEIDGCIEDWDLIGSLGSDATGDSLGPNDLINIRFTSDRDYLYFLIEYAAAPSGYLSLQLDLTGDSVHDVGVLLANTEDDWWWNEMIYPATNGPIVGFADAMNADNAVEVRVPIPFLAPLQTGERILLKVTHSSGTWRLEDQTEWFSLPGTW
jgi:hypothetical protein